ncbi:hypothetical protein [Streptomyces sp. NPDC059092]|uniref:hypothetical protein n=1 Tax=Streptomyces sp. NPDC059092 TaxID=3346725 RepID=UPI0036A5107D
MKRDAPEPSGFGTLLAWLMADRAWELPAAGGRVLDPWPDIAATVAPRLPTHVTAVAFHPETGQLDLHTPPAYATPTALPSDGVHDEEMSAAILALYLSAWPNFHADRGKDFDRPAAAPGLILAPTGDPMAQPAQDRDVAARLGAQLTELDGLTHYWMLQDPERGADVLRRFWASLPD